MAAYLAHETGCRNINILHLTSRKSVETVLAMQSAFPELNISREATIGHLMLDVDVPTGAYAKVNPPVRPKEDKDFLWQALLDGKIDHVVTDHACCPPERKINAEDPDAIFKAKAGFGGTEYLLPGIFSEGWKRGLTYNRMAELVSWNPARRFGLPTKGDIAPGYDADLALLDPAETWTIRAEDSESEQRYTPMEGIEVTGRVKSTFLRGNLVYDKGKVVGDPKGQYLKRPFGG
jgi:allantoinase